MVHLDGDPAAPVASEVAARPDGRKEGASQDTQADGDENLGRRQVAPGKSRDWNEEKQQGGVSHKYMQSARCRRFGIFVLSRVLRRNFPVNTEDGPDRG